MYETLTTIFKWFAVPIFVYLCAEAISHVAYAWNYIKHSKENPFRD